MTIRMRRSGARATAAVVALSLTVLSAPGQAQEPSRSIALDPQVLARAADQGDALAQFRLGVMYADGEGVPQDYAEAVRWFRLAADQGYSRAQASLGAAYDLGRGVPQDYVAAHMWANLAATQGDESARELRELLADRMSAGQIAAAQRAAREWRPVQ